LVFTLFSVICSTSTNEKKSTTELETENNALQTHSKLPFIGKLKSLFGSKKEKSKKKKKKKKKSRSDCCRLCPSPFYAIRPALIEQTSFASQHVPDTKKCCNICPSPSPSISYRTLIHWGERRIPHYMQEEMDSLPCCKLCTKGCNQPTIVTPSLLTVSSKTHHASSSSSSTTREQLRRRHARVKQRRHHLHQQQQEMEKGIFGGVAAMAKSVASAAKSIASKVGSAVGGLVKKVKGSSAAGKIVGAPIELIVPPNPTHFKDRNNPDSALDPVSASELFDSCANQEDCCDVCSALVFNEYN